MTHLETAKQTVENTLRAYEQLGRELPDTMTPAQDRQMRAARDAYYKALTAYNGLRGE